ncbi:hypothetical protein [Streptomyces monashensis]|uniref:Uncharacterized protein n=1 Tax=Streptomyces monashensis TaxID=1678012 RepID=A0A1S2P9G5_9ACTN|nr:hypothetical protein [Streptomyces monashensis]OIJ90310.1 hypothetical protein BIV23_40770 [Streptomyces monashensis]
MLSVENGGAMTAERGSGSGCAGLCGRLASVDGATLEAGVAGKSAFVLVAGVPPAAATNEVMP